MAVLPPLSLFSDFPRRHFLRRGKARGEARPRECCSLAERQLASVVGQRKRTETETEGERGLAISLLSTSTSLLPTPSSSVAESIDPQLNKSQVSFSVSFFFFVLLSSWPFPFHFISVREVSAFCLALPGQRSAPAVLCCCDKSSSTALSV